MKESNNRMEIRYSSTVIDIALLQGISHLILLLLPLSLVLLLPPLLLCILIARVLMLCSLRRRLLRIFLLFMGGLVLAILPLLHLLLSLGTAPLLAGIDLGQLRHR